MGVAMKEEREKKTVETVSQSVWRLQIEALSL